MKSLIRRRTTPERLAKRARIVLAGAEGKPGRLIAVEVGVMRTTVQRWLDRYELEGLEALEHDRPRPGRPKTLTATEEEQLVRRTLTTSQTQGAQETTPCP